MKNLLRWIRSTIKLQTSTLMAWLLVASPILASDLQPGEYLNSTNDQSQQSYQGYTQTQNNYQQQPQQNWTPQPAQPSQPSYYGQVQTGQNQQTPQNYNSGYQQPVTNVNMNGNANAWRGAQPTSCESNTQNSGQSSSAQNDPNSGATARAMGQVATKVLPMAAAMVGMGLMNKMRTGSMMGYPSYGGYGGMGNMMGMSNGYGYGNSYGGYGGGYGGSYGGYGMNSMINPMSRMGMGMGNPMMNMLHF